MFEFRLYLYDLNFNDLNDSIDLFPALLNEDISLTIERERGVFEKTNSDLSLSFSNLVKLENGLTIFKYLKDKIATSKFRIKVGKDNQIVFDGYVENESISYDVENETLELNVFAIEKEFWKRCEQIKFSEVNPYMSDGVANIPNFQSEPNYIWTLDYILLQIFNKIYEKQYFQDILNLLKLDVLDIVKNQKIGLRDNTLKTGMYWLDRDKFSLKEFFEAIIKIYNLEFKIDYDLKQGIFRERLVVNNSTAIDISKDVIKSGITYSPQIEKFDLIKVNDVADINNEELFNKLDSTFAIDTGNFHHDTGSGFIDVNSYSNEYPNPDDNFWSSFRNHHNFVGFDLRWAVEGIINWGQRNLKVYLQVETNSTKFISNHPIIERTIPDSDDDNQMFKFTIPIISDLPTTTRTIFITGATIPIKWVKIVSSMFSDYRTLDKKDIYPLYIYTIENNTEDIQINGAQNTDGSLIFTIHYFLTEQERNDFIFYDTHQLRGVVYIDRNNNFISNEIQIKRANIFELENEIKLSFHESDDDTLNTDKDKPKDATRIQIQKMFGLGGVFYQNLISSFKNILKSTSKIECEVNRDDLRIGDKVTINYDDKISGDFIVNKNEIDLVNGISKIEALSEVI